MNLVVVSMSKHSLGNGAIDIGATHTRVAHIVDNQIIDFYKFATDQNPYIAYQNIILHLNKFNYEKIGLCTCGPVIENNFYGAVPNLKQWQGFNILDHMPADKQTIIVNDANASAVYESTNYNGIVIYITISTGIGGGFVIDNKLFTGATNNAFEIHRYVTNGKSIEKIASGTGILNEAIAQGLNVKTTKEVFALQKNSVVAANIIDDAKINLIMLLNNICALVNPHHIIVGGSVITNNIEFYNQIKSRFKQLNNNCQLHLSPNSEHSTLLGINKILEEQL